MHNIRYNDECFLMAMSINKIFEQRSKKLNVCSWNDVTDAGFIEENLTGDLYLTLFKEAIDSLITVGIKTQVVAQGKLFLQGDTL